MDDATDRSEEKQNHIEASLKELKTTQQLITFACLLERCLDNK